MQGVFYKTLGIKRKIEPKKDGITLWECNKGHITNYLQQKIRHVKDGRMIIKEVCPACHGKYNSIGQTLKALNDKIKEERSC
jgi:hypothetical protein